jgi:putative protease
VAISQNNELNTPTKIILTDEDGISITKEIPLGEPANSPEKMKETFIKQFSKTGDSDFYITNLSIEKEIPFMPVSAINQLRRDLLNELMHERIKYYNKNKESQKPLKYTKFYKNDVDYKANVHNKAAKEFYEKCGVKVLETSLESKQPNKQVQLMHCKHCIKYALNMCKTKTHLVLRDEFGKKYDLSFDCKNCEMSVLSSNQS